MCAFDLLPAAVRAALRDAGHNWSARQVRQEMRRTKAKRKACMRDAGVLVAFIADQDKREHDADAQAGRVCGGQRDEHRGMAAARVASNQLVLRRVRVAAYRHVMWRG
jgi:hypothetical protein